MQIEDPRTTGNREHGRVAQQWAEGPSSGMVQRTLYRHGIVPGKPLRKPVLVRDLRKSAWGWLLNVKGARQDETRPYISQADDNWASEAAPIRSPTLFLSYPPGVQCLAKLQEHFDHANRPTEQDQPRAYGLKSYPGVQPRPCHARRHGSDVIASSTMRVCENAEECLGHLGGGLRWIQSGGQIRYLKRQW